MEPARKGRAASLRSVGTGGAPSARGPCCARWGRWPPVPSVGCKSRCRSAWGCVAARLSPYRRSAAHSERSEARKMPASESGTDRQRPSAAGPYAAKRRLSPYRAQRGPLPSAARPLSHIIAEYAADGRRKPGLLPQSRRLSVGLPGPHECPRIHSPDRSGSVQRRIHRQSRVERLPRHPRTNVRPPLRAGLPPHPRRRQARRHLPPQARRRRP